MNTARLDRGPDARAHLLDVREEERRRLARELHDGPAQAMAAALFGVDLAVTSLDRAPAVAREELLHARGLLRDALDDLRALMGGLRPRHLEEQGLIAALQSLAGTTPLWGPVVTLASRGISDSRRLPPEVELALYRIAQEAVSNARRHGAATHVQVTLERRQGEALLQITDDGQGFPPAQIRRAPGNGQGLPGMRERAALLGGTFTIESAPGAGTRITVAVPLAERDVRQMGEGER